MIFMAGNETIKNLRRSIMQLLLSWKAGEHYFHTEEQMQFFDNRVR